MITQHDEKMLSIAIEEANKSKMFMRHGCVISYKKRLISKGHNHYRSKFKGEENLCSCHAEMHAMKRIVGHRKI